MSVYIVVTAVRVLTGAMTPPVHYCTYSSNCSLGAGVHTKLGLASAV